MSIEADFMTVAMSINKTAANLSNPTQFFIAASKIAEAGVKKRLMLTKSEPNGTPWSPWKPMTAAYRMKKGNAGLGLLFDSGNMMRSISSKRSLMGFETSPSVSYAEALQNGRKGMKKRPFMGFSIEDKAGIETAMLAWIERSMA